MTKKQHDIKLFRLHSKVDRFLHPSLRIHLDWLVDPAKFNRWIQCTSDWMEGVLGGGSESAIDVFTHAPMIRSRIRATDGVRDTSFFFQARSPRPAEETSFFFPSSEEHPTVGSLDPSLLLQSLSTLYFFSKPLLLPSLSFHSLLLPSPTAIFHSPITLHTHTHTHNPVSLSLFQSTIHNLSFFFSTLVKPTELTSAKFTDRIGGGLVAMARNATRFVASRRRERQAGWEGTDPRTVTSAKNRSERCFGSCLDVPRRLEGGFSTRRKHTKDRGNEDTTERSGAKGIT